MNATRALVRTLSTTVARQGRTEVHGGYSKIRSKMQYFQINNGVPIHLKGGPVDTLLFAATAGLNAVGLFMCLSFFYDMSFPKKKE
ncbi:cytochrome c oxidase subunit 7A, mitochondrial-like [Palaemon carinicauda]|uniref:cytochrome c oxidase subunit 7A, mitochondrial-like n=1 Tax=Palaemon carinicauda TaxID=392227 RepID=UPI0035B5B68A